MQKITEEELAEWRAKGKVLRKQYYDAHKKCPICREEVPPSGLYIGFIMDLEHPENFRDTNEVKCKCGWVGTTHDLV